MFQLRYQLFQRQDKISSDGIEGSTKNRLLHFVDASLFAVVRLGSRDHQQYVLGNSYRFSKKVCHDCDRDEQKNGYE